LSHAFRWPPRSVGTFHGDANASGNGSGASQIKLLRQIKRSAKKPLREARTEIIG
jgi:hypothetical protein